ncbi:hypothetical protein Pcinc_003473 [Petrolisthes cinctipes]|uniref:PHD-type domain-containing protein n=1 Tax=Petrolisthes cinctipes TaxID=88211 RepID=A0AAE1GIX4_PETCI|nr:hypothetical protein Pcinc_003473 [Petrolisthes cinctipes]
MEDKRGKETCMVCERRVSSDEEGLQCDGCQGWYHRECEEMDKNLYLQIGKHKGIAVIPQSLLYPHAPLPTYSGIVTCSCPGLATYASREWCVVARPTLTAVLLNSTFPALGTNLSKSSLLE